MSLEVTPQLMAESQARSREFFMSPDSYGLFDLTRDHRIIRGCIEPRDPMHTIHGDYKTIRQTAGGGIGEGTDQALAVTAVHGEPITVAAGIKENALLNPLAVFDAHYDCAYEKNLAVIVGEIADPSDMTRQTVHEWGAYFNERDHMVTASVMVMGAAKVQLDLFDRHDTSDDLHALADEQFPAHQNVYAVRQPNISRTYVTVMHPYVGKDRNKKPVDVTEAQKIQGYTDTLAANIADLGSNRDISKALRGMRFAALLLRSAATRTVITEGKLADFTFIEVLPDQADTRSGLCIQERHY